ncbi:hypothetical protein [Cellulomonas dongxiuzhuiae]|uniref:hypothetical protein n=1 Tax=Cellulomonas dongxiuzhuiae TaxID=2819979 RepID=UPI001AAF8E83|nr:hypothetical protein [Cellulomonas dongxiuzhuiae]MBO3088806.1 hypothetical protein [Cellulomonas dongxiuzhuiae]
MVDELLLTLAVIAALLFVLAFSRVDLILIHIFGTISSFVGMMLIAKDTESSSTPAYILLAAGLATIVGYAAATQRRPAHLAASRAGSVVGTNTSPIAEKPLHRGGVYAVVLTSGTLAVYHLTAVGIPLFSDNIEVDRFDFTSSGLLGIPGRMFLFGVQLSWVVAAVGATQAQVRWHRYGPWIWSTSFLAITSLLGGLKSGAIAFVTVILIAGTIIVQRRPRMLDLVRRYWLLGIGAVAYLIAVTAIYPTYANQQRPLLGLLIDRVTVGSATPKLIALERSGAVPVPAGGPLADFYYFMLRYTGQDTTGLYSVERAISASMIGVDPASDAWTTPVTVGGAPELIFFFGLPTTLVIAFLLGVVIARLYRLRQPTARTLILAAGFGLLLNTWKSRGGLAYYTLNYLAVAAMLVAIYAAWVMVNGAISAHAPRRPMAGRIPPSKSETMGANENDDPSMAETVYRRRPQSRLKSQ